MFTTIWKKLGSKEKYRVEKKDWEEDKKGK